jgi:hypothetical protein
MAATVSLETITMIIHSDSELGLLLAVLLTFAAAVPFLISVILVFERRFWAAAKVAGATLAAMVGWAMVVTLVSFATPQTIVKVGDSYCEDIRCIGIDRVQAEVKGSETIYKLDVHLFSDANTVKVSFGNVSLVLVDERGRRFPITPSTDASEAPPYDTYLDPGQTIKTNLTFAVASDAKELFLMETPRSSAEGAKRASIGGKQPPVWAPYVGVWLYLAWLGNDASPLHKPTMLRVL